MKYKKLLNILFLISITASLSSCYLYDVIDEIINIIYTSNESDISIDYSSEEYDDSIRLLNLAFNGTEAEKTNKFNITDKEELPFGAERISIDNDVKDLLYNQYTTPSKGKVKALVIPVQFEDAPHRAIEEEDLPTNPDYFSLGGYYYNSSYGQLDMSFTITNWYTCKNSSSYYKKYRAEGSTSTTDGVDLIIEEALASLEKTMDLSSFDSNNDKVIDAIYIVYSKPYDANDDFWWAYQYYDYNNLYYDKVTPFSYVFASFEFLFDDKCKCNASTFVHETGHLLGLEDYYDYKCSGSGSGCNTGGLGGADMMDSNIGDQNPFSKLSMGWISNPILITTKDEITLNLSPSAKTNDCVILANNFDTSKGLFQEYFLIDYYTNEGMNGKKPIYQSNGIRIYRIDAKLKTYTYSDNDSYEYYEYDNSYTKYNLIDLIINGFGSVYAKTYDSYACYTDNDLFLTGESLNYAKYNGTLAERLNYQVTVKSLNNDYATLKISYIK